MSGKGATSGTRVARPKPTPKPAAPRRPPPRQRKSGWGRVLRNVILTVLAVLIFGPIVAVLVYKVVPPPVTILMLERMAQGQGLDHRWVSLSQMSPALPRAAVASEDGHFCSHHGFDFDAIQKAMKHDEKKPNAIRGGSTISQQTAKNVFLWPDRSWVRKGFEAYFTVLIEVQAARLIAILPSPLKWQVVDPGAYVRRRSGRIDKAEGTVSRIGSADCIG